MTYGEAMRAYQDAIGDALKVYADLIKIVPAAQIGDYFLYSDTPYPYIAFRDIAIIEDQHDHLHDTRGTRMRTVDLTLMIVDDAKSKLRSTQVAEKVELALASPLTLTYGSAPQAPKVLLQGIMPNDELAQWQTTLIVRTDIEDI